MCASLLLVHAQSQRRKRVHQVIVGAQIEQLGAEQRWRGQLQEEGELDLNTLNDEALAGILSVGRV